MAASLLALGACGQSHGPEQRRVDADSERGTEGGTHTDAAAAEIEASGPLMPQTETAADAAVADAGAVISALGTDAVPSGALARNVLYSWTSELQVAELRARPVLLTRSESITRGRTRLSAELDVLATQGDALATLLTGPEFQKGRYAWSNAWATRRDWPDESYGTQLLRIVLKPEALIVVVAGRRVSAIDAMSRPVDPVTALAQPERIAAVYFVSEGPLGAYACGSFAECPSGAYREYFINNERMVQEWSVGTQAIRDEIERGISQVRQLRDWLSATPYPRRADCSFATAAVCTWLAEWGPPNPSAPSAEQLMHQYRLALALTSEYYQPSVENMDALLADLSASLFVPNPFVHMP